MKTPDSDRVNNFLEDLQAISPDKLETIGSIRKIFLSTNHEITEEIKYGGLVFNLSNALIGGIFPYKDHISIEFSNGAGFPDPLGILEGKGKKRRHLKIHVNQDIEDKNVGVFVSEAIKNKE